MSCALRVERAAVARRLLAAGRLCQVRMGDGDAMERHQWCVDNWEAVAAEVAAELGVSRGRASSEMNYGVELVERLPKLGAAMAAGLVDFRVVMTVVFRTGLITDAEGLAVIDAQVGAAAPGWNVLSRGRGRGVVGLAGAGVGLLSGAGGGGGVCWGQVGFEKCGLVRGMRGSGTRGVPVSGRGWRGRWPPSWG